MISNTQGGQITWNLDVNSKKFDTGLQKASNDAQRTAAEGERSFSKLGGVIATTAKVAAVAFGAAAVASLTFGVKSAASFEQTRIGLENMLGSADVARKLLSDISKFAAETPFEFPELAQATRQLVAFGFSADEAFSTMKQLGDVSAAIGAPINDIAYLMGTLRTQGRAFTIDIRQFAQRGIPIYEYLAKVLNKSTQEITTMIEEGQIGFPEVQKAFQAMTAEGGKFYNTMSKQSRSVSGLFSTLKDVLGQTARELIGISQTGDIIQGSLFDRLRIGINTVINDLPKVIDTFKKTLGSIGKEIKPAIDGIGKAFRELRPYLENIVDNIRTGLAPALMAIYDASKPIIAALGGALVTAIKVAANAFSFLMLVASPFIYLMINNKNFLTGIIAGFIALKGAMMIWDVIDKIRVGFEVMRLVTIPGLIASFSSLAAFLATPMGLAVAGVSLAVGILTAAFLRNKLQTDQNTLSTRTFTQAQNELKDATDKLKDAEMTEQGAKLQVERAQRTYNDAVRQYGPASLEAREASYQLKRAQNDLAGAQKEVNSKTSEFNKLQTEVKNNNDMTAKLDSHINKMFSLGSQADSTANKIRAAMAAGNGAVSAGLLGLTGRYASGTNYAPGGMALVGEQGPEIVNLPRGSQVIPNHKLGGSNISNNIGTINIGSQYMGLDWLQRLTRQQELAQMGMVG